MSNEVSINATVQYSDSEDSDAVLQVLDLLVTVASKKFTRLKQNVGTSEEALLLGEVTSLGIIVLVNRDPTNFVKVKESSSGIVIGKLHHGIPMIWPVGSGISAPYLQSDTAACQVDVLVIST